MMKMTLDFISKQDLKEVLSKNWLTHDAMWFALSVETIGMEKTNAINRKAAHSMAQIEAKRMSKVFNIGKITNVQELKGFMEKTLNIVSGEFMKYDYKIIDERTIIFDSLNCFAYEGVNKLGVISDYECGIFERIEGWFDYFNIRYTKEPNEIKCLMHLYGSCSKKYTFTFSN